MLAHSFPRFAGDTHGPFVERLSEELARLGHEVHVLVPFDPALVPERATPLASIRSFRYVWPDRLHLLGYSRTLRRDVGLRLGAALQAPLYFPFAVRALRRLVEAEGIELVHAHWLLPNGWVAERVRRATGVPFAVTVHGSDVFMAERNALFRRMARRTLAGAAHVTSCSAELAERLVALGGREHAGKVILVPNGTDLAGGAGAADRAGAVAQALAGLEPGDRLLVAVGRLVDKKGFRYLIEAMPAILAGCPRARLLVGGGGDLAGELAGLAARLGLGEAVRFTGPLSHDQVLALVAAAEVFVMPSVRDARGNVDGLPVVVLEAMAAGKPVVATAVSGLPLAVVEGESGRLVAERDPAALAAAVLALLADPAEARRLGEGGRRRVEAELNWPAVARLHDRLYRAAGASAVEPATAQPPPCAS